MPCGKIAASNSHAIPRRTADEVARAWNTAAIIHRLLQDLAATPLPDTP